MLLKDNKTTKLLTKNRYDVLEQLKIINNKRFGFCDFRKIMAVASNNFRDLDDSGYHKNRMQ